MRLYNIKQKNVFSSGIGLIVWQTIGFITKGRNSKGQRKIRPNGIKPNFQKAQLNFRPKIKKGRILKGRIIWLNGRGAEWTFAHPFRPPASPTQSDRLLRQPASPTTPTRFTLSEVLNKYI